MFPGAITDIAGLSVGHHTDTRRPTGWMATSVALVDRPEASNSVDVPRLQACASCSAR